MAVVAAVGRKPRFGAGFLGLALLAGVLCALATPPALGALPGAEFLVIPGLAAFYALATAARRPYVGGYLVGLLRVGCVAWSVRFVAGGATVAIVLVGAVYDLLVVAWTRGGRAWRVPAPLAFGLGIAATAWLRANMPEISYPHGQASHALYLWPSLLGPVAWGGEVLANGLLAWVSASCVDVYRAWRVATPAMKAARLGLAVPAGLWLLLCVISPPGAGSDEPEVSVDVLALEPGDQLMRNPGYASTRARLVDPTLKFASPRAENPPDLVLWPESSMPQRWLESARGFALAPRTRLLGGTTFSLGRPGEEGGKPVEGATAAPTVDISASILLDHHTVSGWRERGPIAWQEKRVPVPAAERLPWLSLLPQGIVDACAEMVGYSPVMRPGASRPPLETAAGVRFGALMCFDNAFAWVARENVAQGARFLAVISNEIWYRGGAELDQMVAMSVFRALETDTPVIRSTVDGLSVHVDRSGRVVTSLGHGRPPAPNSTNAPADPRFLRAKVDCGPGGLGPLAWIHPLLKWIVLASVGLLTGLRRHN